MDYNNWLIKQIENGYGLPPIKEKYKDNEIIYTPQRGSSTSFKELEILKYLLDSGYKIIIKK